MSPEDCKALTQKYFAEKYAGEMSDEAAQLLARVDPEQPESVYAFLRVADTVSWRKDLLPEAFKASILWMPASHARNIVGNGIFQVLNEALVRPLRVPVDMALSKLSGRPREFYLGEVAPAWLGVGQGLKHGTLRFLRIAVPPAARKLDASLLGKTVKLQQYPGQPIRYGAPLHLDPSGLGKGQKIPIKGAFARHPNKAVRTFGAAHGYSFQALSAEDAFSRAMAFSMEAPAYAVRRGVREGLKGAELRDGVAKLLDSPDEKMLEHLKSHEEWATFNDEMSQFARRFSTLVESVPAGRFLAPFIKIADRLAVRSMELTPYGFVRARQANKAGRYADTSDLTARASVGTMLMGSMAAYAINGSVSGEEVITGWAPPERNERERWYESGKQPWSVRVNGKWVPFQQISGISYPLAFVAAAASAYRDRGELPEPRMIGAVGAGIGRFILDQSMLSAISDLIEGINRPTDPGGVETALYRIGTAVALPFSGGIRAAAQALDPELKRPGNFVEAMEAQLPFFSQMVPEESDRFGQPIVPAGGRMRGIGPKGAGWPWTSDQSSEVARELIANDVSYGRVTSTIRLDGQEYKLTRRQRLAWQQARGQAVNQAIGDLIATPDYRRWPPASRAAALRATIEATTAEAKRSYLQTIGGP